MIARECRRILKPQGKLVVVTPNLASQGHHAFREAWVHLDPPRHLYLFSPVTLRDCCERVGLQVETLRTSARTAAWVWAASDTIRRKGSFRREADFTWRRRMQGMSLLVLEEISGRTHSGDQSGEELILTAGAGKSASVTAETSAAVWNMQPEKVLTEN